MQLLKVFDAGDGACLFNGSTNAMLALDEVGRAIVDYHMGHGGAAPEQIRAALADRFSSDALDGALREMEDEGLFGPVPLSPPPPRRQMPLNTMVLHLVQDCNLACSYCYGGGGLYGGPKKMMTQAMASDALDFLIAHGGDKIHITFFGGEPVMNWSVLKETIQEGEAKAAIAGKQIDFSFTTNATLLSEERVDFLSEHHVGLSVSMDGPPDIHDANRPFSGGANSYDVIAPKVAMLLARHKTRPIGARVTLTHGHAEAARIFDHLIGMGFAEVGLSPVTSPDDSIFLHPEEMDAVLSDLRMLAERTVQLAMKGQYLGFSNIINLWQELHAGLRKTYACGAGLGLLSVSVDGKIYLCHRFNGVDGFQFGDLATGVHWGRLQTFLGAVHVDAKQPCQTCWVKHLCGGGCYYEALERLGDATASNRHYCEFVQAWIETGIQTYGRLWAANPDFFDQLAPRKPNEAVWPGEQK